MVCEAAKQNKQRVGKKESWWYANRTLVIAVARIRLLSVSATRNSLISSSHTSGPCLWCGGKNIFHGTRVVSCEEEEEEEEGEGEGDRKVREMGTCS
jgi:hypothetical protein